MSRRGVLAAAIPGLMACSDVLGPGPDVELTVILSQDLAVPGENVTITIAVHNPGERDVSSGETKVYGFLWSPYSDYGSSAVPLPAGEYHIFAGFAGEPLRPPFSDRVPVRVEIP